MSSAPREKLAFVGFRLSHLLRFLALWCLLGWTIVDNATLQTWSTCVFFVAIFMPEVMVDGPYDDATIVWPRLSGSCGRKCTHCLTVLLTSAWLSRCAVRSALEADEDDEEEEGWELPSKRVPANMRMLLGEAPKTLCLHFPRRHQR